MALLELDDRTWMTLGFVFAAISFLLLFGALLISFGFVLQGEGPLYFYPLFAGIITMGIAVYAFRRIEKKRLRELAREEREKPVTGKPT